MSSLLYGRVFCAVLIAVLFVPRIAVATPPRRADLLVTDFNGSRVLIVRKGTGVVEPLLPPAGSASLLAQPGGVGVGSDGAIYVGDFVGDDIVRIDPETGEQGYLVHRDFDPFGGSSYSITIDTPRALATAPGFLSGDQLYVAGSAGVSYASQRLLSGWSASVYIGNRDVLSGNPTPSACLAAVPASTCSRRPGHGRSRSARLICRSRRRPRAWPSSCRNRAGPRWVGSPRARFSRCVPRVLLGSVGSSARDAEPSISPPVLPLHLSLASAFACVQIRISFRMTPANRTPRRDRHASKCRHRRHRGAAIRVVRSGQRSAAVRGARRSPRAS